jgi:hypothetical protein
VVMGLFLVPVAAPLEACAKGCGMSRCRTKEIGEREGTCEDYQRQQQLQLVQGKGLVVHDLALVVGIRPEEPVGKKPSDQDRIQTRWGATRTGNKAGVAGDGGGGGRW